MSQGSGIFKGEVPSAILPQNEAIGFAAIGFAGSIKTTSGHPVSQHLWWSLGYWYQHFHRTSGLWQN